jgi:putative two-component system response regulator
MRDTILIVDDEELNRELLRQMFETDYKVLMAKDGKEAITQLGKHMNEIAIILLDIVMPVLNGYQVLQVLHAKGILDKIPVILITAQDDAQTEFACYSLGATAIINKPFVAQTVRKRVVSTIELYQNVHEMETTIKGQSETIDEQKQKLEAFNDSLLDAVSNLVEFRNLETGDHVKRVKGLTRILAVTYRKLYPEAGLTKHRIEVIVRVSALHDLGKIAIPDSILLKPGRLTDDERKVMMSHTTKGCEILNMLSDVQDQETFKASYEVCRHHHERHDGKGYPDGLKGDEIPLSAQLVSLADVYDALVSERVYKKAFSKDVAYNMIMDGECGTFSPKLIKCLEYAKEAIEAFVEVRL